MQPPSTKSVQDKTWLGGDSDPLRIAPEAEIWPYCQMV